MEKTDKPAWVKNFEDPYSSPILPGYWNKSVNGKTPEQHGGYKMANGGRGGHSETSSLYSRYTSTSSDRSDRKRSNRIALCIILTIIALIIAALIGLLVYFLLMTDRPRHDGVSGVDGSVRVLNMTYDDDMANTSSQAFRDVAEPFCAELDSYIAGSNYSDRYEGCEVIALRNVADVTDCLCLDAKMGNVMVNFQLHFNGTHENSVLTKDIHDVIEKSVTKIRFDDIIYVLLKYFLVDIRFDWTMSYDAIEADVTLPVYNLNYSLALTNNQSREFIGLARPFCRDVDGILTNTDVSWLAPRYTSCHVTGFSRQTDDVGSVSFTLHFAGRDPRPLQQGLLYVLYKGARDVVWGSQQLKMIGSLLITPFGATNQLRPVNETEPEQNITYVTVTLPVFNLTLTPELGDPRSPYFINITTDFCNDFAKFYALSSLKDRYYSCKVLGFRPKQPRIEFQLGFIGDRWPGLTDSVVVVVRAHAPDRIYATWRLYKVGRLEVILDEIVANGLELHTSLRVVNLTYISALADPGSPEFLHHAVLFCTDLEEFFKKSSFADRFVQCGLKAFTPRPVKVHFFMVFKGTSLDGLTSAHYDVITSYAERVYLNTGWLAHRVGDLLVLPERYGHSIYPTNITFTRTSTPVLPPTSDVITTSIVIIDGEMTKATITGLLYNFTFLVDLLDRNSPWFKYLERRFCDDVSRVYLNSFLFLTYRGCQIDYFSPSPDEVTFSLYFDTKISKDLEWGVKYVLTNDSPKVTLTLNDLQFVEALHLGDLYLALKLITLHPTPSTSFPMPSTSDVSPTAMTTAMSSTVTPSPTTTSTPGPDIVTSTFIIPPTGTNVTLRYPLLNFTFPTGLGDPTSEVFETYQRLLCLEIQEVFKASRSFYLLYDGCGINKFGFGDNGFPYVDFHLLFNTGFTDLLYQTTIGTLEDSRPHRYVKLNATRVFEYMPIGGLLLILNNRTASSTVVTSSMTQTMTTGVTPTPEISATTSYIDGGGVLVVLYYKTYGLGYTDDLKDSNSPRFLAHRQKVCSDIEKWYRSLDSPFYLTYHGCDLVSFSSNPEGVMFTITLRTDMKYDIGRHIRTYLEHVAPKHYVPGFILLKVGDLYLIADQYTIKVTVIPEPSDSYTVFTSHLPTSSMIQPTSTSAVPPSSSFNPTIHATVSLRFGLADFIYSNELNYDFSPRYLILQRDFCAELERFYKSSTLSPFYKHCQIDEFIESPPDRAHKVTFTLVFEMPFSQYLVNRTVDVILEQEPKIILDGYVTVRVGDLYLILDDWRDVSPPDSSDGSNLPTLTLSSTYPVTPTPTTPATPEPTSSAVVVTTPPPTTTPNPLYYLRMSFELANFTWHPDLEFPTSPRFQIRNQLFCDELDTFLPGRGDPDFRHYMSCNIDNFSGQPMRVNFSLQFDTLQGLNIDRIQRLVISVIKEHAIRHTVGNLMVYRLGDLFIDLDSVYIHNDTSITTVNLFDGIAFQHTYNMNPANFSEALLDKTSYEFKTRSYDFCRDIDSIFDNIGIRNIRERYVTCQVDKFSSGPFPKVTFTVAFRDTDLIDPERLNGIIVFSRKKEGSDFFYVGGLHVSSTSEVGYHFIMLGMLTTNPYPYTTTPVPAVYTYVDVKLRVMSPSWTEEFDDPSSPYYRRMVKGFCNDVSGWMKAEKPNYVGCKVIRISNNPMMIEAQLQFIGQQTGTLDYEVGTILLESPDWDLYGTNIIGFKMGEFVIYEESLDPRVSASPPPGPPATPPTTPTPTPTRPANPCVLGGVMYRHATLCDRFLHCAGGQPIEIPCGQGSVFLDNACKTPTTGFECTPLPGAG